jgi:hypothetical protein
MSHPLPHRRPPVRALLAASALAAACHGDVTEEDPDVCPSTGEFGNAGCIAVEAEVLGVSGQPLEGIAVTSRPLAGRASYGIGWGKTDATGHVRVRTVRLDRGALGPPTPDTVSVWVIASDPQAQPPAGLPWLRDSALAVVTVAPVGALPVPAIVRLRLPLP